MSETTPTYPRLPLSEVPGYAPDGPVWLERGRGIWSIWLGQIGDGEPDTDENAIVLEGGDADERDACALILDPTGAASLARAVAARVGLDVSGGVRFRRVGSGIDIVGDGVVRYFDPSALLSDRCIPALDDAPDTLSALAIVARTVLT